MVGLRGFAMKALALAFSAAVMSTLCIAAAPAQAGVYVEFNAPGRYHRPPPFYHRPPVYYGAPARVYYAPRPAPRVCRVTYVREWGPFGPHSRRVETCRERW